MCLDTGSSGGGTGLTPTIISAFALAEPEEEATSLTVACISVKENKKNTNSKIGIV